MALAHTDLLLPGAFQCHVAPGTCARGRAHGESRAGDRRLLVCDADVAARRLSTPPVRCRVEARTRTPPQRSNVGSTASESCRLRVFPASACSRTGLDLWSVASPHC